MAKDLEFTAKAAADHSKSARADETLKKLIDAWNSKNARSATRVGSFGFMAATLAACGGGGGGGVALPDGALPGGALSAFRFLTGSESALVIQSLDADPDTAANDVLDVSDLLGTPDAAFDASAGVVIPAGETYVGDISLVDGGIAVSGDGNLWLLAPAADFTGNSQTVALDIDLNGGTLTFDMESDADTIIIDAAQSRIDLNGGTLQISDGTVLVSAAEYATWNVGDLIVNSTLEVDFREAPLTDAEISSLVSALDAATEAGNTASAVRFLVKDDAQATLVFEALEENTALAGGTAPKVEVKGNDGTSVTVNLDAIIDSKLEFLTESLEKQIDALKEMDAGDYTAATYKTISDLSAAVTVLQTATGAGGALETRVADLETQLAGITTTVVDYVDTAIAGLQGQIDTLEIADIAGLTTALSDLDTAVTALQTATGTNTGSTSLDSRVGDLEASLDTLISQILTGPGFALAVAEASDLPSQSLGANLIANYRLVDTAANIEGIDLASTLLSNAKAVVVNDDAALTSAQVSALSSRSVDWSASSFSLTGNAAELVGLAPVVLNGASDLAVTGDVSAAQANTFMSAQNSGTTTIGSLVVSAAEAAAIQFDANDVVSKVTVTGSHVDNTIDLSHFPLGTEIVFTGRAGGETLILPEGTTGDGVDTYNLAVDLASGKGDDTLVFYGGGDEDTASSDTLVVSGEIAFAGGENTLTLVGSVDFSQVVVTSTIIRFSDVAANITTDDTFTFTFAGAEYVATVGATAAGTATADEVQAAIDGAVLTSDGTTPLGNGKIAVSFETGDTSNLLFTSLDADNPFPTAGRFTNVDGQGATTFGFGNFSVLAFTGSASAVAISPQTVSLISGFAGDGITDFEVKNADGEGREVVDLSYIDLDGVEKIVVGNNVTAAVSLEQAAKTTLIKSPENLDGDGGKLVAKLEGTLDVDLDLTGSDFDVVLPATDTVDGGTLFMTAGVTLADDAVLTVNGNDLNNVPVTGTGVVILSGEIDLATDLSHITGVDIDFSNALFPANFSDFPPEPSGGFTMSATVAANFPSTPTDAKIRGYGDDGVDADLSGITNVTFLTDVALDVPNEKVLTLTPAQANGLVAGGEGVVNINTIPLSAPATIDLTGISAGITFAGQKSADVIAGVTLVLTETQLMASSGIFANHADAVLRITEVTGTKDISTKITLNQGSMIAELIDEDISGVSSGYFSAVTDFDIAEDRSLTLTAEQADGKATTSAGATVIVTDGVADTQYAFAELVPTGSGSTTITYASGTTLDAATTFAAGQFVNVTAAMVDNLGSGDYDELNNVEQVTIFDIADTLEANLQGITADVVIDIESSNVVLDSATLKLTGTQTLTVKSDTGSEHTLDITNTTATWSSSGIIDVGANTVLRLTDASADDQLKITGEGSVRLPYNSSVIDLSTVATTGGLTIEFGASNSFDSSAQFPTDIPVSFVTTEASATVDLTAVTQTLSGNITVDENVTLKATAAQLDGVTLSGAGSVEVLDLHDDFSADLSGVTADSVSIYGTFANSATFDGKLSNNDTNPQNVVLVNDTDPGDLTLGSTADIGTATFDVGSLVTLIGTGAQLDGTTVTGAGAVTVNDVAADHDLSGIGAGVKVEGLNGELAATEWSLTSAVSVIGATDADDSITLTNSPGDSTAIDSASASITFSTSGVFTFSALREGGTAVNLVQLNGEQRFPQVTDGGQLSSIGETAAQYSLAVEAGDVLTFSVRGQSNSTLAQTEVTLDELSFTPDGSPLDVTASIDANQDISASTDFATVDSYVLSNEAELTLTLEQASGVEITGTGSVNLVGASLSRSLDLTKIAVPVTFVYDNDDETPDEISVSSQGANILLTTEQADGLALVGAATPTTYYNANNTLVVISGDVASGILDLSGIQNVQLGFDNDTVDLYSTAGSIEVANSATLVLHASTLPNSSSVTTSLYQATGDNAGRGVRWDNSITGEAGGTVRIVGDFADNYSSGIQLRHISPDLTLEFVEDTFNIGTGTLYIDSAHLDGQTINAGSANAEIRVYGDKDGIDLSKIGLLNTETLTINLLSYEGTPILTGDKLPKDPSDNGDLLRDGMELYLKASQITAAETNGSPVTFETEGTVRVRMNSNADTSVDLSGITAPADQLIAEVAFDLLLDSNADFGAAVVDIAAYYTLAATLDQFDGVKVIGNTGGTLSFVGTAPPTTANDIFDLTQIASDIDFSGLTALAQVPSVVATSPATGEQEPNDYITVSDGKVYAGSVVIDLPILSANQDVYFSAQQLAAGSIPDFSFDEANSNSVLYVTGDLSSGILDLRDLKGFSDVSFREHWYYPNNANGNVIDIGTNAEILLTLDQINNTSTIPRLEKSITGEGTVTIEHDGTGSIAVDLSVVDAALTTNLLFTESVELIGTTDLSTVDTLTVGDEVTARAKDISGLTIDGQGTLVVTELDDDLDADLRDVDLSEVEFDLATQAGSVATINFTGYFGTNITKLTVSGSNKALDITGATNLPTEISVGAGAGLVLTAAQADNLSITGEGNVDVFDLGTTAVDLSGIAVTGTQEVFLAGGATASVSLDPATDLGNTEVVLRKSGEDGQTVTFQNIAQADARTVVTLGEATTGKTEVVLDITSDTVNVADYTVDVLSVPGGYLTLEGLNPAEVPVLEMAGSSEVNLDVDSANTLDVTGDGIVRIELSESSRRDFDFSKVVPAGAVELELTADQVLDAAAQIGAANLVVTGGNYTLDVSALDAGHWGISSTDQVTVNADSTLKLRANQATELNISGSGSVVVTDIDGTSGVDLAHVVPSGGVTIELSTDTMLANTAVFGQADLIVTGAHTLDVTDIDGNSWPFTSQSQETITVAADSTLKLTAAQADGLAITGAGQVVVTDIDSTLDADLSGVVPYGGVTIDLTDLTADAVLTSVAEIGKADLTVTGPFELDVTEAAWGITEQETVTVETDTTLRLTADQADTKVIKGAGNVTVEGFGEQTDLSDVTATGTITLERGSTNASEKFAVELAGTDVDYVLDGAAASAGDFILKVAGPDATGSATIDGFATGNTHDAFDQLDFTAFTNVTGTPVFLSKETSLTTSPISDGDLVIFKNGSANSAESIAVAFDVDNGSDFVNGGEIDTSVNDLMTAGDEMIFGVRTQDLAGNEIVNFWHWDDAEGDGEGKVDASEMTLFATLNETFLSTLTEDNFILAPEVN